MLARKSWYMIDMTLNTSGQALRTFKGVSQNSVFEREKSTTPGRTKWIIALSVDTKTF